MYWRSAVVPPRLHLLPQRLISLYRHDVALELYDEARRVARTAPRCGIARARIFRARGQDGDARDAFAEAERLAEQVDDEELRALLAAEKSRS